MDIQEEKQIYKIIEGMQPIINKLATKWSLNKKVDREDLVAEGNKALLNAIKGFKERG